jgi:hypothetical protein
VKLLSIAKYQETKTIYQNHSCISETAGALFVVCFKLPELFHTGCLSDPFIFFSVTACKQRWKHIRTVFVRHLHDKTPSGSSATKKRPYYLHDAMKFMIPHITKNRHQESNLAASQTEEDTAFSGENKEDIQMNEASNKNVPENITPSKSSTMIQASCQRNQDDCRQRLFGKRRRLTALDLVDTSFMNYMKQQRQSKTPDPDAEFLHSLLPDMKSMTAKQKRTFKIGALNLMDELLEDTESDQQSSTELSETSTFYHTTSLQEAQDSSQSVLTCWETE